MPADELFEQLNNNSVSEVSNVICITMFMQFCIWIFYCILHLLKWNTKNEKKKYRSFSLSPYGTGTGKLWNKPSLLPVFVNEAWLKHSHAPLSPLSLAALFHNSRVECLWLRPYSSQNPKYLLSGSSEKAANSCVNTLPHCKLDFIKTKYTKLRWICTILHYSQVITSNNYKIYIPSRLTFSFHKDLRRMKRKCNFSYVTFLLTVSINSFFNLYGSFNTYFKDKKISLA